MRTFRKHNTCNVLISNSTIEDFALRRVSKPFRRWSEWQIASTALGGISFLALEVIGAMLIINYGFTNFAWAILFLTIIIILTGIPIAYHASNENIDIDLLTRGAGFGYIGSTITSLIYAFFTIIYFGLETAIMGQALFLCFGIPLPIAYLICSLVVIPFSLYGITALNKLHNYTQFLWIFLWVVPLAIIIVKDPESVRMCIEFEGNIGLGVFDPFLFGSALSILVSLIPQIGEQVDILRFLPDKTNENKVKWWLAVLMAGPGWIIIGALKLFCGAFLVVLFLGSGKIVSGENIDIVELYHYAFLVAIDNPLYALVLVTIYVLICQIKINPTNAYAGSLAWSNFFSRITQSHPGRAVWLSFNILLSILFTLFGVLETIHSILFGYAILALPWIGAIVADLTVIKPLGLSPKIIEYKRAYLYNINPVGVVSIFVALLVAIPAYFGAFGIYGTSFSTLIAFFVAFITAPVIAVLTKGKYYIRREHEVIAKDAIMTCSACQTQEAYEEMIHCPVHNRNICALCCSLNGICDNKCNQKILNKEQKTNTIFAPETIKTIGRFMQHYLLIASVLATVFFLGFFLSDDGHELWSQIKVHVVTIYIFTLCIVAVWVWWFTLIQEKRIKVEEALDIQIGELEYEVEARKIVSDKLNETSIQQKMILENATIGIAFIVNTKLKWCNKVFLDLCSFEKDLESPVKIEDLFWDKKAYRHIKKQSEAFIEKFGYFQCEMSMKLTNSNSEWRALSINPIDIHNPGQGVIWLLNDINRQKIADEALLKSKERLKELNENLEEKVRSRTLELEQSYESLRQADKLASMGVLVSGMAHEINNPINLVCLNSQTMLELWKGICDILTQQRQEHGDIWIGNVPLSYAQVSIPKLLHGIHEGGERVSTIVRNLKDYSRQSSVKMEGKVNINGAVKTSQMLLNNLIRNTTDSFIVNLTDPIPLFKGDLGRIEQVLVNLIQNSCQALKSKADSISIETYSADSRIFFKITDKGIGISEKALKLVRDPFYTTKRELGGTGLGLSVSAAIIEEHKGVMSIESKEGVGTSVTLSFISAN